ncbi:DUF4198 domain-containing protein [Herbaspirillum robiniae]|nr:DUF4198 domain-containing protein [Herbaspirillum robiniae]
MNFPLSRGMSASMKVAALALAISLPLSAHAHRQWLLPSATVFSGANSWVTVDAAVSTKVFYFDDFPLRLDGLAVTGPDGKPVKVENANTGKHRSSFDLQLPEAGTYKLSVLTSAVVASYKVDGQQKRWRGSAEAFAKDVPANAADLKVSEMSGRVETFVTSGKPNKTALAASGAGLEMVPVTHPNDLVADEPATFQLLLDGKPAGDVEVTMAPDGSRYRDTTGEFKAKTDADGKFSVKWPGPGIYWLGASTEDKKTTLPQASQRRASYVATVEVLP